MVDSTSMFSSLTPAKFRSAPGDFCPQSCDFGSVGLFVSFAFLFLHYSTFLCRSDQDDSEASFVFASWRRSFGRLRPWNGFDHRRIPCKAEESVVLRIYREPVMVPGIERHTEKKAVGLTLIGPISIRLPATMIWPREPVRKKYGTWSYCFAAVPGSAGAAQCLKPATGS